MTASGQDANFQVFPLAFGVVDSENDEAWTWFLQKVVRILADSRNLTIISDRHRSIYNAKKRVYPFAHHGACLVHLPRNVNAVFKSKGLAKLVGTAVTLLKLEGIEWRLIRFDQRASRVQSTWKILVQHSGRGHISEVSGTI